MQGTYGNYLSRVSQDLTLSPLLMPPGYSAYSPAVTVGIPNANVVEVGLQFAKFELCLVGLILTCLTAWRLYDESFPGSKYRMCLNAMAGLLDMSVIGTQAGSLIRKVVDESLHLI